MWNRVGRDELLEHPTRRAIVELARHEPGIHFSALLDRLTTVSGGSSLGYGSLSYHLYTLERGGILASRTSGRLRRFYATNASLGNLTLLSIVQRQGTLEVAQTLCTLERASQTGLAQRNPRRVSRQSIGFHLTVLERAGLVRKQRMGREFLYEPTVPLRQALERVGARSRPGTPSPEGGGLDRSPVPAGITAQASSTPPSQA